MKRWKEFITELSKQRKLMGLIIGFAGFLLVTQILFCNPAPVKWLDAVWEAGDLISFVGTITLGIIAISQTEHESKVNDRLMQLEENRYKLEMRPFVIIDDWFVLEKDQFQILTHPDQIYISLFCNHDPTSLCIALALTNTTQSYVSVTYGGAKYVDSNKPISEGFSYTNIENKAVRLQAGESKNIVFYGDKKPLVEIFNGKKIRFKFILQNRFGEHYREDIDVFSIIREIPTDGLIQSIPHVLIETSIYDIGKYTGDFSTIEWEKHSNNF